MAIDQSTLFLRWRLSSFGLVMGIFILPPCALNHLANWYLLSDIVDQSGQVGKHCSEFQFMYSHNFLFFASAPKAFVAERNILCR